MAVSSSWRHVLCRGCYGVVEPGREPQLVVGADPDACCCCGEIADPPVFYRADPERFGCGGRHEDASGE